MDKQSDQIECMTTNEPPTNTYCISSLTENRFSPTLIKQTQIKIFDMLNTQCANELGSFLLSLGYSVINDNKNIQKV